jgi:hypothetical protein
MSGVFKDSESDITLLSLTFKLLHTPNIAWQKCFNFGKSRLYVPWWDSYVLCLIPSLPDKISYYVNSTSFFTPPIYYKLLNTQGSDQYTVHKINTDNHMVCELHETETLYTAERSLYDGDCAFLLNQTISCSCSLINICTTAQQYIGPNVRKSKEIWSRKFKWI